MASPDDRADRGPRLALEGGAAGFLLGLAGIAWSAIGLAIG